MTQQIEPTHLLDEMAARADAAEVFEQHTLELPVNFRAGALESLRSVETAGRALRVLYRGRVGFSTTTDFSDARTVVENALESAAFGDPVTLAFPAEAPLNDVLCFDAEIEALTAEQLVAMGDAVVERLRAFDPELQIEVRLKKAVEEVVLMNTRGLSAQDQRTALELSVRVTKTRGDDIFILREASASRRRRDVDGVVLADRLIERLRWSEKTVGVASKALPVVFNLQGLLVPLLPLFLGLDGRQVHYNSSPLDEKLGQQVFDRRFTLIDDGRLDYAMRSSPFDDEGVPTTETPLIVQGVVKGFLYDLNTAAQAGVLSTGNGVRTPGLPEGSSFRHRPSPSPSSWRVAPGQQSLEQILAGLDEALLVEAVLGLGQGNVMAGEFSNNVAVGFLVRRGEIAGRVKNTMVAGNVYQLLRDNLIALGDRSEWVEGLLYSPALAVDGVSVASRG